MSRGHDLESLLATQQQQEKQEAEAEHATTEGGGAVGVGTEEEEEAAEGEELLHRPYHEEEEEVQMAPLEAAGASYPHDPPPPPEETEAVVAAAPAATAAVEGEGKAPGSGPHQLMREEERITGAVKPAVYMAYVRAVRSPLLLVLAAVSFIVANGTQFLQQVRVIGGNAHVCAVGCWW